MSMPLMPGQELPQKLQVGGDSEEVDIGELIYRVQVHIFPRRIRMKELFKDYDPMRCGRCSRIQFAKAMTSMGMQPAFTSAEVEAICNHFHVEGPRVMHPQDINYAMFCEELDHVFNPPTGTLERKPQAKVLKPGQLIQSKFVPMELPADVEGRTLDVLHKVAALCKARGVSIKDCYMEGASSSFATTATAAQRRVGQAGKNQFIRYFPFQKELDGEEMDILMERYTTKNGDIHFGALHHDVTEVYHSHSLEFPRSTLFLRPDHTEWDHHSLTPVQKIQAKVVERRIRLRDLFQDFDPRRTSHCTGAQVRTALTILGLSRELTKDDMDVLIQTYANSDNGMFNYELFCQDVDGAFATRGLEKDPLAVSSMPDVTTTMPARRNKMAMSMERRSKLDVVEDLIRRRILSRRMLVKPTFKAMDHRNWGHLTKAQFSRAMVMLGFELSQESIDLLCSEYCDLGNHNDFNYVTFCKTCDPADAEAAMIQAQMNAPAARYGGVYRYFDKNGKVLPAPEAIRRPFTR